MTNIRPGYLKFLGLILLICSICCGCGRGLPSGDGIEGKIHGDYSGCATGAYVSWEGNPGQFEANISTFETMTDKELAVVSWYVNIYEDFPLQYCNIVRSYGAIPMINLEFWLPTTGTLEKIANDFCKDEITSFALAAKNWGHRMFLRPMHEMNGNWYPWSGAANGGAAGTSEYIEAWKHIYNIFSNTGAKNVTFVWSPNNKNIPPDSWNQMQNYYPGDEYVDWMGVDGYSLCGYNPESSYETFSQVFSSAYASLEAISTTEPKMISEFSCAEGPDKPAWISDAFWQIKTNYTNFKVYVWFNKLKEQDWRVNSSTSALTSFKSAVGDTYFKEQVP